MGNTETAIENAEQKILTAARNVFIRKGFAGARMQEIADEAGINKALLHYYFRSKEKLFEVIFKESFGKLLPKGPKYFNSRVQCSKKLNALLKPTFRL